MYLKGGQMQSQLLVCDWQLFSFLMKNYRSQIIEYTKYLDLNEKQKIKEAKWKANMQYLINAWFFPSRKESD